MAGSPRDDLNELRGADLSRSQGGDAPLKSPNTLTRLFTKYLLINSQADDKANWLTLTLMYAFNALRYVYWICTPVGCHENDPSRTSQLTKAQPACIVPRMVTRSSGSNQLLHV